MDRKRGIHLIAVGLLALALSTSSGVCLNCCTPDITQHVALQKASACGTYCARHATTEMHECSHGQCGEYLSVEGVTPNKVDANPGGPQTAPLFVEPQYRTVLAVRCPFTEEGLRLWRTPPPPFQTGRVPRLI